jgi:hypothetical protein
MVIWLNKEGKEKSNRRRSSPQNCLAGKHRARAGHTYEPEGPWIALTRRPAWLEILPFLVELMYICRHNEPARPTNVTVNSDSATSRCKQQGSLIAAQRQAVTDLGCRRLDR